jgi:hypothetical protein
MNAIVMSALCQKQTLAPSFLTTLERQNTYDNSAGGVRLNFCRDKYRSALSASQRGSRSPPFAALKFLRLLRHLTPLLCQVKKHEPSLLVSR